MTLELKRAVYVSSYSLVAADDVPARDPRKWDIRFNIPQDSKQFIKSQYEVDQIDEEGNLLLTGVETTAWP